MDNPTCRKATSLTITPTTISVRFSDDSAVAFTEQDNGRWRMDTTSPTGQHDEVPDISSPAVYQLMDTYITEITNHKAG